MLICNRKFHFFTANFRVTSTSTTGTYLITSTLRGLFTAIACAFIPIYAVTLKSSAEATQKRTLTGIAWIRHSDNYDIANINSMDKNNLGNGVSTIYKTPIAKSDKSYTTWFIVNPAELPAGELTISVTTATKTITRTVNSQILSKR